MSRSAVVVDDSKLIVHQISEFLSERMGVEVLAVGHNGNDAIELYRKHRPDLITLDLAMPKKTGREAIVAIREEFPDARILVISVVHGEVALDCMRMGIMGFIEKPLKLWEPTSAEQFRLSLEEVLRTPSAPVP